MVVQVSDDGGKTWMLPPVPARVAFASPFQFSYPNIMDVADMSGIVRSPKDGYYYVLHANNFLQNGVRPDLEKKYSGQTACRTPDPTDTSKWRCWNGSTFSLAYSLTVDLPFLLTH